MTTILALSESALAALATPPQTRAEPTVERRSFREMLETRPAPPRGEDRTAGARTRRREPTERSPQPAERPASPDETVSPEPRSREVGEPASTEPSPPAGTPEPGAAETAAEETPIDPATGDTTEGAASTSRTEPRPARPGPTIAPTDPAPLPTPVGGASSGEAPAVTAASPPADVTLEPPRPAPTASSAPRGTPGPLTDAASAQPAPAPPSAGDGPVSASTEAAPAEPPPPVEPAPAEPVAGSSQPSAASRRDAEPAPTTTPLADRPATDRSAGPPLGPVVDTEERAETRAAASTATAVAAGKADARAAGDGDREPRESFDDRRPPAPVIPATARAREVDAAVRLENLTSSAGGGAPRSAPVLAQPAVAIAPAVSVEASESGSLARGESPFSAGVVRGLSAMINQRGGVLNMRLEPPDLGQLRIQMSIVQGTVSAQFTATTPHAHAMLDQHLTVLRSALESQGLTVDRLAVHLAPADGSGANRPEGGDAQQHQHDRAADDHDAAGRESTGRRDGESRRDGDHHAAAPPFRLEPPVADAAIGGDPPSGANAS